MLQSWAELIHVHIFRSYLRHLGWELLLHHRLRRDTLNLSWLLLNLFNLFLSLFLLNKRLIYQRRAVCDGIWVVDQKFSFGVLCNFKVDLWFLNRRFNLCKFLSFFLRLLVSFSSNSRFCACGYGGLGISVLQGGLPFLRLIFLLTDLRLALLWLWSSAFSPF